VTEVISSQEYLYERKNKKMGQPLTNDQDNVIEILSDHFGMSETMAKNMVIKAYETDPEMFKNPYLEIAEWIFDDDSFWE